MPNGLNWKVIDGTAQRVGGWAGAIAAATAIFAGAVTFMTWVTNSITVLAAYGWGAPVLVAIGIVLVIVVAMSFAAVPAARAWRTFRPLKAAHSDTETATPASDADELAVIRGRIDEVSANLADARNSIVTTFTNLALDRDKRLDSISDKISGIEAISNKNSTKLHEIGQESPRVFDIIMEVLAHSLLFNAIPSEPELLPVSDLTPDNIERQRTIASEYFEGVRQALSGTQWEYNVRGILQNGSDMADHFVRMMPVGERPSGIDPLDLRQYAIFRIRCEGAGIFVRSARAEARSKYRGWLSLMKQLYEARKSRS